jgi:hypothetical protein
MIRLHKSRRTRRELVARMSMMEKYAEVLSENMKGR